ncbi:MAG TPA: FliH/SctL family protein [Terracidiphilus sp.]|jgi:flagellar assembly protein FliH|nr:FliH/SctL family protein [Terracidiphilus sp.]
MEGTVEGFVYPSRQSSKILDWTGLKSLGLNQFSELAGEDHSPAQVEDAGDQAAREEQLNKERLRSFELGRSQGRTEGQAAERNRLRLERAEEHKQHAEMLAGWIVDLSKTRDVYFQSVEHKVVELALSIAARILRREAQMDPLLLTSAVRVALGQLAKETSVQLYVPECDLVLWRDSMAHAPDLPVRPQVLVGEGMKVGDCAMSCEIGSADLSIRAQLEEIQRGFFGPIMSDHDTERSGTGPRFVRTSEGPS